MYKRSLAAFALAFSLVANTFSALPAHASVIANSLIKVDGNATVYWHDNNNERHAFQTPQVFNSWFSQADLSRVLTVSPAELSSHPLGGSVTYRPGIRLIKVTTDPKVYAVSRYGTLRWISSEAIAIQLYGNNWARQIDDVRDDMFFNYQIGDPITRIDQYNAAFESGLVRNPSDNIRPTTKTPPLPTSGALLNGRLNFSVSNSSPVIGSTVSFSANLDETSNNAQDLSISFMSTAGETLYICTGTFRCNYVWSVGSSLNGFTRTYFARVKHANGQTRDSGITTLQVRGSEADSTNLPSNNAPSITDKIITPPTNAVLGNSTLTIGVSAPSSLTIVPDVTINSGSAISVVANVQPVPTNAVGYVIVISDQDGNALLTCRNTRECLMANTVLSNMNTTDKVFGFKAQIQDAYGASYTTPVTHVIVRPSTSVPPTNSGNATLVGKELQLVPDTTTVPSRQAVLLKAQVVVPGTSTLASGSAEGFKITIFNEYGEALNTCLNTLSCDASETVYYRNAESDNTRKYTAAITDTNNLLLNAVTPIINVGYVK